MIWIGKTYLQIYGGVTSSLYYQYPRWPRTASYWYVLVQIDRPSKRTPNHPTQLLNTKRRNPRSQTNHTMQPSPDRHKTLTPTQDGSRSGHCAISFLLVSWAWIGLAVWANRNISPQDPISCTLKPITHHHIMFILQQTTTVYPARTCRSQQCTRHITSELRNDSKPQSTNPKLLSVWIALPSEISFMFPPHRLPFQEHDAGRKRTKNINKNRWRLSVYER